MSKFYWNISSHIKVRAVSAKNQTRKNHVKRQFGNIFRFDFEMLVLWTPMSLLINFWLFWCIKTYILQIKTMKCQSAIFSGFAPLAPKSLILQRKKNHKTFSPPHLQTIAPGQSTFICRGTDPFLWLMNSSAATTAVYDGVIWGC